MNPNEVINTIENFSVNKTTGLEGIFKRLLNEGFLVIASSLRVILS